MMPKKNTILKKIRIIIGTLCLSTTLLYPHTSHADTPRYAVTTTNKWGTCTSEEANTASCKLQTQIINNIGTIRKGQGDPGQNNTSKSGGGIISWVSDGISNGYHYVLNGVKDLPIISLVTTGSVSGTAILNAAAQGIYGNSLLGDFTASLGDIIYNFANNQFHILATDCYTIACYLFALWLMVQCTYLIFGLNSSQATVWSIVQNSFYIVGIALLLGGSNTELYWEWFVSEPLRISNSIAAAITLDGTSTMCQNIQQIQDSAHSQLIATMTCMEGSVENTMKNGMVLGLALPFNELTDTLTIVSIIPENFTIILALLLMGMAYVVAFALIIIYYTFFLIDIVMKLCIVSAFAPIFIGFSALPNTRRITWAALNQLTAAFVNLTIMTVILNFEGNILYTTFTSVGNSGGKTLVQAIGSDSILLTYPATYEALIVGVSAIFLSKKIHTMVNSIFESHHHDITASRLEGIARTAAGYAVDASTGGVSRGMKISTKALKMGTKMAAKGAKGGAKGAAGKVSQFQRAGGVNGFKKQVFQRGKR